MSTEARTSPVRRVRLPVVAAVVVLALVVAAAFLGNPLLSGEPGQAAPGIPPSEPAGERGARTPVAGRLLDADGRAVAGAVVRGCGGESATDTDGRFSLQALSGACALEPAVLVGPWRLIGESAPLAPEPAVAVDLRFTPLHAVVVRPFDLRTEWLVSFPPEGLRVQMASEEMSARYGVFAGDAIVAIDGVRLAELTPIERLRAAGSLSDGAPALEIAR